MAPSASTSISPLTGPNRDLHDLQEDLQMADAVVVPVIDMDAVREHLRTHERYGTGATGRQLSADLDVITHGLHARDVRIAQLEAELAERDEDLRHEQARHARFRAGARKVLRWRNVRERNLLDELDSAVASIAALADALPDLPADAGPTGVLADDQIPAAASQIASASIGSHLAVVADHD